MAMQEFSFDIYKDWFEFVHLSRDEHGVLEIRLHREDGILTDWGGDSLSEVGLMFSVISQDSANRVIVFTGTGDAFITAAEVDTAVNAPIPAEGWVIADSWARRLQRNLLNIEVPIIAAVNGPFELHSELAVLSDLVIAADTASFQDTRHFTVGVPPGDGAMIPWLQLLGPNRGRQFLLEGQLIGAEEALQRGVVAEVLPQGEVLARAHQIAHEWATTQTTATLRLSRRILTREYRRLYYNDADFGAMAQGLAAAVYWPSGKAGADDL